MVMAMKVLVPRKTGNSLPSWRFSASLVLYSMDLVKYGNIGRCRVPQLYLRNPNGPSRNFIFCPEASPKRHLPRVMDYKEGGLREYEWGLLDVSWDITMSTELATTEVLMAVAEDMAMGT